MAERLLIVGASGRAAAASALRAGFEPFVLDLFADADTRRLCPVWKLPTAAYPHGFVALAERVPPMPWLYTGGLENHPDVVAAISATRELQGVLASNLDTVRDPFDWSSCLDAPLAVVRPGVQLAEDRRWLRKPFRSAAGSGVRWTTPAEWAVADDGSCYAQEYADGPSLSVLLHGGREHVELIGCSRQLIGTEWLHARPFQYAGNLGPVRVTGAVRSQLDRIAWWCQTWGMIGLFGVDFVLCGDRVCPVEFNPRYPASVEVYEFAAGIPLLDRYSRDPKIDFPNHIVGKAIYYAPRRLTVPASGPWDESLRTCTDVWRRPDFADIPHAGDVISAGQPVCTLLAEAATEAACESELRERAAELDRLFGFVPSPLEGEG